MEHSLTYAAFMGHRLVANGPVEDIVTRLHPLSVAAQSDLRLFDEATGKAIDIDWRGSAEEIIARAKAQLESRGRGRPRLGVESREITLLPKHWAWLDSQSRSASATVRQLVDHAMGDAKQNRGSIDALYSQISALAGDLPSFEEATRRLYANDWHEAERIFTKWPGDLSSYFIERLRCIAKKDK